MKVRKIGTRMGARIEGIDFEAGLNSDVIEGIASALYAHQIVAIPATKMRPEQHLEIAHRFGVPEQHATDQFSQHEEMPEITVVDSEAGNRADSWHADETFLEHPPIVNLLHAKLIPETGGDTAFISMAEAYDGLSPKFQDLLEGLTAIHDYGHLYELGWRSGMPLAPLVANALAKGLIHSHPVVRTHPVTERKWITVNSTYTRFIEGLNPIEATMLLDLLLRHMQKPEFGFRHHWSEGDLLIWDQQAVQHYAVHDSSGPRVVHRIAALANADTYTGVLA